MRTNCTNPLKFKNIFNKSDTENRTQNTVLNLEQLILSYMYVATYI